MHVILHGEIPFVWNAEDIFYLKNLRIVGSLVGALPGKNRQNELHSVPMQLMNEEVTLLLELGECEVYEDKSIGMVSDIGHRDLLLNYYKLNDIQTREIGDSNSVCLQTSLNNELNSNTFPITCANYRNNIEFSSSKKSEKRDDIIAHGIHIDTTCRREQALIKIHWSYPNTSHDKLRYRTFKDLYDKGYYLTSGVKYGGDFLAYPGDPSRFHAFFVVYCTECDQSVDALNIISMGRLSSDVRKTLLLYSLSHDGMLKCLSVRWTGMVSSSGIR